MLLPPRSALCAESPCGGGLVVFVREAYTIILYDEGYNGLPNDLVWLQQALAGFAFDVNINAASRFSSFFGSLDGVDDGLHERQEAVELRQSGISNALL